MNEKDAYKILKANGYFDIRGAIFLNGKKLDPTNLAGKTFGNVKSITVDEKVIANRFHTIFLSNLVHIVAGGSIIRIVTEK